MESWWGEDLVGEKGSGKNSQWEKEEIRLPNFDSLLPGISF